MTTTPDRPVDHLDRVLVDAALAGPLELRACRLTTHLYKIDARDPHRLVVWLADDLGPADRVRAASALTVDLHAVLRRRRRAGLEALPGGGEPVGPATGRGELVAVTA